MSFRYTSSRTLADLFDTGPLDRCARRIADRVGDRLLELVRELTPVYDDPFHQRTDRKPGTLKRSWEKGEVEVVRLDRIRITVETFDPVAPHVEWRTSPHVIRPKRPGGVLRFYNSNGDLVFTREVHHPGTQGAHMMSRALDRLEREWLVIARQEMSRWEREQVTGR